MSLVNSSLRHKGLACGSASLRLALPFNFLAWRKHTTSQDHYDCHSSQPYKRIQNVTSPPNNLQSRPLHPLRPQNHPPTDPRLPLPLQRRRPHPPLLAPPQRPFHRPRPRPHHHPRRRHFHAPRQRSRRRGCKVSDKWTDLLSEIQLERGEAVFLDAGEESA